MDLQCQEYLTFSKAAVLMGCTRQYVYKLVANGKLKASRLSSRMAFVRKADIERMFESNPYKQQTPYWRILRHSRWPQQHHGMGDCRWGGDCLFYEQDSTSGIHLSPQDTYQAWVWSHLYSKEHLEELRRTDLMSDDNYYTTEQVQQLYGLTSANICHIVKVHHINKVKVGVSEDTLHDVVILSKIWFQGRANF